MLQSRKFFPQFLLLDEISRSLDCIFHSPSSKRRCLEITGRFASSNARSTIDAAEIEKFGSQSSEWWSKKFYLLRQMNALRVPLVRDGLLSYTERKVANITKPLGGFRILDVGCGGGLLAEPLARLGADVTGLDPSDENIQKAVEHCSEDKALQNLNYVCDTVENFKNNVRPFDALVCSEVVEHVDNVPYFVQCCTDLVKSEGSLFFTTINQTLLSYVFAIVGAEYILGLVPKGTHHWSKFVKPEELQSLLESYGCRTVKVQGMMLNPLTSNWSWSSSLSVSYALHAVKDV